MKVKILNEEESSEKLKFQKNEQDIFFVMKKFWMDA